MRNTVRASSGTWSREWDIDAGLRDPVTIAPPLHFPPIPDPQCCSVVLLLTRVQVTKPDRRGQEEIWSWFGLLCLHFCLYLRLRVVPNSIQSRRRFIWLDGSLSPTSHCRLLMLMHSSPPWLGVAPAVSPLDEIQALQNTTCMHHGLLYSLFPTPLKSCIRLLYRKSVTPSTSLHAVARCEL
uniref:Uncharacterized protein n=1 Tax=Physcomitrium patens TaxID=3218 RepID=A9RDY2_PHYPA|nr:hypothetical protein PHYPA_023063 [Physcomitrium patens]